MVVSGLDGQDTASVGSKFFDGMLNSMYLNKIKANLKAKEDSFGAFSTAESADSNMASSPELKVGLPISQN